MAAVVDLLRHFALDWINRADRATVKTIMREDYTLEIGGLTLDGRDSYAAATAKQLELFPHLALTVHEIAIGESFGALAFTEHGPSSRHGLTAAAWLGVAIFWSDGARLIRCVTEEDYLSRKRQLASGRTDVIWSPAAAPWSEPERSSSSKAEEVVRDWLLTGGLDAPAEVVVDDRTGLGSDVAVDHAGLQLLDCESAGNKVAVRGLMPFSLPDGVEASLSFAGLLTVQDGAVYSGWIVRDRLAIQRVRTPR